MLTLHEGLVVFCPWEGGAQEDDTEDDSKGSDIDGDEQSESESDASNAVVRI